MQRVDHVSFRKIEADRADDAREHDDSLLQREACADADPRPGAERQIGEAVDRRRASGRNRSGRKASGSSHSVSWRWST